MKQKPAKDLTFDQLPQAVMQLSEQMSSFEKLLLSSINPPKPEADELLTIKQAGALICLSVPTIYGLVSRAEIPVCKRSKRLYFSKQELTDWIKAGRKKTASEIEAEAGNYFQKRRRIKKNGEI